MLRSHFGLGTLKFFEDSLHALHRTQQLGHFVFAGGNDPHIQIAFGHLRCHTHCLTQRALSDLEPLITKSQVVLTNRIQADLPPVDVDPAQLLRVLCHLITNALKHNPPGICLMLNATVEGGMIRCTVQDNGVGMTARQCRHLFELYTRGHRARYVPGLGLGLYLCRQIIHAHGGRIGVTSTPGAGATFWFTVPLCTSKLCTSK